MFVFLCGQQDIFSLISLPQSAIWTLFYPNKTSLAKLLIAQNKISIDWYKDQSLYLRAALLALPVTGIFS